MSGTPHVQGQKKPSFSRRRDPALDRRRLLVFVGVLLAVYAVALGLLISGVEKDSAFLLAMYAPFAGAIAARYLGPGVIQWGRPSWWILTGLVPVVVVLVIMLMAAVSGSLGFDGSILAGVLILAPLNILTSAVSAFGEEVGWRGFLWPLLRGRVTFVAASAIMIPVWWAYHIPFVATGDYGSWSGVPAFTVALVGFTLFVGVITDMSRSLWPSVVAHAAWNTLVATDFDGAFAGSPALMGEFGWLAALGSLVAGVGATVWYLSTGRGGRVQAAAV